MYKEIYTGTSYFGELPSAANDNFSDMALGSKRKENTLLLCVQRLSLCTEWFSTNTRNNTKLYKRTANVADKQNNSDHRSCSDL